MLYSMYEFGLWSVAPFRLAAMMQSNMLRSPLNPMADTEAGRTAAAAADLFESMTRRYGKPEWRLPSTRVNSVDVPVTLSPEASEPVSAVPLCALMAGWLRGRANPAATAEIRVYAGDLGVDAAVARGRGLRAEIDEADTPIGVLVVADGANTVTPSAPGGYDPDAAAVQNALDDALARGDAEALTRLPTTIVGRVAYQVLAGLTGPGPRSARELVRGAPYGVGYFVGAWAP